MGYCLGKLFIDLLVNYAIIIQNTTNKGRIMQVYRIKLTDNYGFCDGYWNSKELDFTSKGDAFTNTNEVNTQLFLIKLLNGVSKRLEVERVNK